MMNAQQLRDAQVDLYMDSEAAAMVMGNAGCFVLFERDTKIADQGAKLAEVQSKGYHFSGVLALKDGQVEGRSESDFDSQLNMMCAFPEFGRLLATRSIERDGDAVEWLQRLHRLPDSRPQSQLPAA